MPIRSLNSSVIKWPDRAAVHEALRTAAQLLAALDHDIVRVGYIGSYADDDWSVGSDLDVLVVVASSDRPFSARAAAFDFTTLPVPADVMVYTQEEFDAVLRSGGRFADVLREAVWVYPLRSHP